MNCAACRQRLHPYLDDELDVSDHVALLEHLDRCAACRGVFHSEERVRKRLRSALTQGRCPDALRTAFAADLRREARRETLRRYLPVAVAAAAALIAVVAVRPGSDEGAGRPAVEETYYDPDGGAVGPPSRLRFASRVSHPTDCAPDQHGAAVTWAERQYDALVRGRLRADEPLSCAHLPSLVAAGRDVLPPDEFFPLAARLLGRDVAPPSAFVADGVVVGGEILDFAGRPAVATIVGYPDRELVVYEFPSDVAPPCDLHALRPAAGRRVSFATCPACDVVTAVGDGRYVVLVSRHMRDWSRHWMIEKARTL